MELGVIQRREKTGLVANQTLRVLPNYQNLGIEFHNYKKARSTRTPSQNYAIWALVTESSIYTVTEGVYPQGEGHKMRTRLAGGSRPQTCMKEMSGDAFVPESLTLLHKRV